MVAKEYLHNAAGTAAASLERGVENAPVVNTVTSAGGLGPGQGRVTCANIGGKSRVVSMGCGAPLKLLAPLCDSSAAWVYSGNFGGGLVSGDHARLHVEVQANGRLALLTQASTKVYRPVFGEPCRQELHAQVAAGAVLAVAPDPVVCFTGAIYRQRQTFHLQPGASLLLVDWYTSGRYGGGERWAFQEYASRNVVYEQTKLLINDGVRLKRGANPADNFSMQSYNCLATMLLTGPAMTVAARMLLAEFARAPWPRRAPLVFAISPLGDGCIIRAAAESCEALTGFLTHCLRHAEGLYGRPLWSRKW